MQLLYIFIIVMVFLLTTAAGKQCANLVPGLKILSFGIDNKEADWYLSEDLKDFGVWKTPVIDFTCDQNKRHTVPNGNNGEFEVPDQVYSVVEFPTEKYNATATITTSSTEAIEVLTTRFDVEAEYLKTFRFSAGVQVSISENTIKKESKFLSIITSTVKTRKVLLPSENPPTAGSELAARAAKLPSLSTSPTVSELPVYKELFDTYGMVYLCQVDLGGMYVSILTTESTYLYNKNVEEVEVQAEAYFNSRVAKIGASSETTNSNTVIDEAFEESTTVTLRTIGGSPSKDYNSWKATVSNNPLPISGKLCPITNLIRNPVTKRNMVSAVTHYELSTNLKNIYEYLGTLIETWDGGTTGKQKLQNLRGNVSALTSSQTLLTLGRVQPVLDKFDFEVKTPEWFKAIKLCFDWFPGGNLDQCTAKSGKHLCAVSSELTPPYVDNTYGSSGGCSMKWGLKSPDNKHDPWFDQVKVCYKWFAGKGSDASQCQTDTSSGLESDEVCAAVGQMTADYRDTTDNRAGGCLMSWKLELPSTAPAWSENLRICLRWKATGDGGQCGGSGLANDVCALAGQWTKAYFDNTDGRNGGCEMRWGIRTAPPVADPSLGSNGASFIWVSCSWALFASRVSFFFAAFVITYFAN